MNLKKIPLQILSEVCFFLISSRGSNLTEEFSQNVSEDFIRFFFLKVFLRYIPEFFEAFFRKIFHGLLHEDLYGISPALSNFSMSLFTNSFPMRNSCRNHYRNSSRYLVRNFFRDSIRKFTRESFRFFSASCSENLPNWFLEFSQKISSKISPRIFHKYY